MQLSWAYASSAGAGRVVLHIVFEDAAGSLSVLTTTLLETGVSIHRVAAFCTHSGVAVDTFELSGFNQATADLVRSRLAANNSKGWVWGLLGLKSRSTSPVPNSRSNSPFAGRSPVHSSSPVGRDICAEDEPVHADLPMSRFEA